MNLDFEELDNRFVGPYGAQKTLRQCIRCQSDQRLEIRHDEMFGDQPYCWCPSCEAKGIYPWGIFLIIPSPNKAD